MAHTAEAWFLYPGDGSKTPGRAQLTRESFVLREPRADEVVAEPLYGCWEGNMGHALARAPVDVCLQRKEERVVLGNAGVVRVLSTGAAVRTVEAGQHAILFCVGEEDAFGYPKSILGYDAPGTMGCLTTKMVVSERQLIPIPARSKHSLQQWAAFSLRYITAWSNWQLALGTFRLLVEDDELPVLDVWGWGGGVSLAELQLAQKHGHRAVMVSSAVDQFASMRAAGITPIDRRGLVDLHFQPARYRDDRPYRDRYLAAEQRFLDVVDAHTAGRKVNIFIDLIGEPVYRATLKALSRCGVITTAGWKAGMDLRVLRAVECIERHQHIHTHYARYAQGKAAVAYAEAHDWMPPRDLKTWRFDDIPELAAAFDANAAGMFPVFEVAGS
jgi:NADPH:quinone reductase-like Zn-dependent oxidoreductase